VFAYLTGAEGITNELLKHGIKRGGQPYSLNDVSVWSVRAASGRISSNLLIIDWFGQAGAVQVCQHASFLHIYVTEYPRSSNTHARISSRKMRPQSALADPPRRIAGGNLAQPILLASRTRGVIATSSGRDALPRVLNPCAATSSI